MAGSRKLWEMAARTGSKRGKTLGIILAGGQSQRMGKADKCLMALAGKPLLQRVLVRAAPQVDMLILSANGDPARFRPFDLPIVADEQQPGESLHTHQGPIAGLIAGLQYAYNLNAVGGKFSHMASFACDCPLFPTDLVTRLHAELLAEDADYAVAESGGVNHPVFGLWTLKSLATLEDILAAGTRALRLIEQHLRKCVVRFDSVPFDPFFNINEAKDIVAAEALIMALGREASLDR